MNGNLKIIGFWSEFRNVPNPSFFDEGNIIVNDQYKNDIFLNYLKNGVFISRIRTLFICPFSKSAIGSFTNFSDGEWVWTNELIHFYENNRITLSQEFLSHVLSKKNQDISKPELKKYEIQKIDLLIENISIPHDDYMDRFLSQL